MLKHRIWRYGVPFIIFMLGGSLGLREFTVLRYDYRRVSDFKEDTDIIKDQIHKKPNETTIEQEYEKLQKLDLDNWDNKRIQRPWVE